MALVSVLELEPIGDDVWRGWTPPGTRRADIFGGQVAGQALRAASLAVEPEYVANSVHCYFLRRGRSDLPLDLHVERTRTGRTYASRRVDVRQDGKTIFAMLASFHVDEPGREYDHDMPPGIPGPDTLEPAALRFGWDAEIEVRVVDGAEPTTRWWGRVPAPFSDDPALHLCGLLYASDMMSGGAAVAAIGVAPGLSAVEGDERPRANVGSLDHAIWFHRVPKVDEWFFTEVRPLTVRDSRGLVLGTMFDRERRHLATFTQEVFLKLGAG